MAKQGKLVRQDSDGIWLAASLASEKSGLTKPELVRRALADELAFQPDRNGKPAWYAEPQIAALARDRYEAELAQAAKPKRPLTDAQLEAQYARQWKAQAKTARYGGGGPVTAHLEKAMIAAAIAPTGDRSNTRDKDD